MIKALATRVEELERKINILGVEPRKVAGVPDPDPEPVKRTRRTKEQMAAAKSEGSEV